MNELDFLDNQLLPEDFELLEEPNDFVNQGISPVRRRNEARLLLIGGLTCFAVAQHMVPDTVLEQAIQAGLYTVTGDFVVASGLKIAGVDFKRDVPNFVRSLF